MPSSSLVARRSAQAWLGAAFILAVLSVAFTNPAGARAAGTLSCRASAARVHLNLPSALNVEPVRANAPRRPCSSQSAETLSPITIGPLKADALTAYTSAPGNGASALAAVSRPSLTLGGVTISVEAVTASATVSCASGSPRASGRSSVIGLTVGGQRIAVPANDRPFALNIPLVGTIALNQTSVVAGEVTQRAVVIRSPALGDVVLGEAIAGATGQPCSTGGGGNSGGGNAGGGSLDVCPAGSSFLPGRGLCVIRWPDSIHYTVIGRPYQGPAGGRVVLLTTARKRFKSACLRGRGPAYVVIGTNRADRITGTNHADRILAFAGRDRVDGGGGNDCVDAGKGNDVVAGGTGDDRAFGGSGNDRLYGGSGNDRLSGGADRDQISGDAGRDRLAGGSGRDRLHGGTGNDLLQGGTGNDKLFGQGNNDRLYGQSGNDALHAGYGADRLWGGAGRDYLETAVLGRVARMIDGGSGRDHALINHSDRRHVHHVERIRVIG